MEDMTLGHLAGRWGGGEKERLSSGSASMGSRHLNAMSPGEVSVGSDKDE